jgi:hypothetical protein
LDTARARSSSREPISGFEVSDERFSRLHSDDCAAFLRDPVEEHREQPAPLDARALDSREATEIGESR